MRFGELDLRSFGHSVQMVGVIYSGEGQTFFCAFPDELHTWRQAETHELVMTAEEWVQFLRQSDLLEAEVISRKADGTTKKAFLRKSQRQIDQVIAWRVFRRDAYRCRYCGSETVPLTVDHLVTWETGGPSTEENLVAACKPCNRARGNKPFVDWLLSAKYQDLSRGLQPAERAANEALIHTLDAIPRLDYIRSR
jgi:hypothetical protein